MSGSGSGSGSGSVTVSATQTPSSSCCLSGQLSGGSVITVAAAYFTIKVKSFVTDASFEVAVTVNTTVASPSPSAGCVTTPSLVK